MGRVEPVGLVQAARTGPDWLPSGRCTPAGGSGTAGQRLGHSPTNFWPLGLLCGFPGTSSRASVISCLQGKTLPSYCYPCQGL